MAPGRRSVRVGRQEQLANEGQVNHHELKHLNLNVNPGQRRRTVPTPTFSATRPKMRTHRGRKTLGRYLTCPLIPSRH